ncbi:MAG: Uma2 family endonuclease [Saprospiraceae bacterium]|nr:Uma2 family endonuclease [Saprospiraceae bacterium]
MPIRRFSVEEYYRLAEVGILGPEDKVELINGEIVKMSPIGPRHAGVINQLSYLLREMEGWNRVLAVQNPVRLSSYSEPEPDISILKPRADFYKSGHPTPADVILLVEVADTTFEYDSKVKLPLYAKESIPEYWIIDLQSDRILIYTNPQGSTYQTQHIYQRGDLLSSSILSKGLPVDEILD